MDDHTRILEQLRRTYDGEAWYGPSFRALLADVNASTAAARPIPTAHTIWELVRHVTVWLVAVRRRLAGEHVEYADDTDWLAANLRQIGAENVAVMPITMRSKTFQPLRKNCSRIA